MKKFNYIAAALVAAAIAAPSIASAETVITKHRDHGPRAEMRGHHDHGWRGHSKKVVIIKRGGHHHHHD